MTKITKKPLIFQSLAAILVVGLLAACNMPTEPEGVDTEGLAHLGDQLHSRGDDAGAAEFYSRAIQHKPKDVRIRKSFATLLESHGDFASAADQYDEALKIKPEDTELLRNYGRALIHLGHPAEAKEQYQKALSIDSDDVKALNGLGVSLDYLNDHAAAQKVYREALDEEPNSLTTLGNLGHSLTLSGAWDTAIKLLEPHVTDQDATPAFRQNLAESYAMAGMDLDAERVSRRDLTIEQTHKNLTYYQAQRKNLAPTVLTADLGHFSTQGMAEAHRYDIQTRFSDLVSGLTLSTVPVIKVAGSTPTFAVRVTGFGKPASLAHFCDKLKKEHEVCQSPP
jgi:Flp pilus assembly protein TadD